MHRYVLSGVRLISERAISALAPGVDDGVREHPTVMCVVVGAGPLTDPPEWLLVRSFRDRPEPWLSTARTPDGYLLRIHGHADFELDVARRELRCAPYLDCPEALLDQLIVDQVLPQVLHALGRFSLHASAIEWRGEAVAFAGESGSGKSTLAASLGREHAIVCDDCLAVELAPEAAHVLPSYPGARLCHDSADSLFADAERGPPGPRASKLRVDLSAASQRLALRRVYVLRPGAAVVRIEPLGRREALTSLAEYLHRMDPEDRPRLRAELDFLEGLTRRVRVAAFAYPHDFARLPEIHEALLADLEAPG